MNMGCIIQVIHLVWEFLLTYFIGGVYILRQLFSPHKAPSDLKQRENDVAIVTGGNRGIGLQVVHKLLSLNMHVIIACRTPQKAMDTVNDLRKSYPHCKLEVMRLDVSNLHSVREFVDEFFRTNLPLHLLINNSGVMFVPFSLTEDGFEHHWGVNYLGHFLLTLLLLPKLKSSGSEESYSRIVNVSSCVAFVGKIQLQNLNNKRYYSSHGSYAQSKLAQIMFTWSLQEKLTSENEFVTVNTLHPGVIYSDLYEHVWWVKTAPCVAKKLYKTTSQGADAVVHCGCSSETQSSIPKYYENCCSVEPPSTVLDVKLRKMLWDHSCQSVKLTG